MPAAFHDELRRIVGPAHVLTGIECVPYVIEGRTPEAVVAPGSKEDVAAVLVAAGEAGVPVTPWGGGTAMAVGSPPSRLGLVLLLGRLTRLVEHEPGDLTATVEAGMTVQALQEALGRRGQWLSLDPPHAAKATIGGTLSANVAGPRRHLYGGCRDLLIGLTVVTADGAIVKGGGRVVKNVAGYDLPKLFIGAFGTLGVIVEATLKLRPRPDADRVVVARFERLKDAGVAARTVMASDLLPSALELLDGEAIRALGLGRAEGAALLVGVDGMADQVDWQCREIERLLEPVGLREARVLDGAERDRLWQARGTMGREAFAETAATIVNSARDEKIVFATDTPAVDDEPEAESDAQTEATTVEPVETFMARGASTASRPPRTSSRGRSRRPCRNRRSAAPAAYPTAYRARVPRRR